MAASERSCHSVVPIPSVASVQVLDPAISYRVVRAFASAYNTSDQNCSFMDMNSIRQEKRILILSSTKSKYQRGSRQKRKQPRVIYYSLPRKNSNDERESSTAGPVMGTVDLEAVDCRLCSIWIEDFKAAPKDRYLRRKLVPNSVRNAANNGCPICSAFVDLCSPLTTAEFEVTIGQVFAQNSKRREVIALSTDTSAPIYPCFVFCAAGTCSPLMPATFE